MEKNSAEPRARPPKAITYFTGTTFITLLMMGISTISKRAPGARISPARVAL